MPTLPLNDEQLGIVRSKRVSLRRPARDIIEFLAPLARYDAVGDASRKRLGCIAAVAFVAAVVTFFLLVATKFVFLPLLLAVAGVVLLVLRAKKSKDDLSDNLRATALPFLAALREDFGNEPIEFKLDLRPPLSPEKITHIDKGSGGSKETITTYTDAWMTGEGALADGSYLEWSVVDTIVERKRWKKGASGKTKLKTKRKKKCAVDVAVTLKTKRYDVGAIDAANVRRGENKNVVRVSQKIPRADADPVPAADILNVIAGVYRDLRPAQ